jgi:hypothetical protein
LITFCPGTEEEEPMLTNRGRKYMKQWIETAQSLVPEEVLACGMFTNAGAMQTLTSGAVSPAVGYFKKAYNKEVLSGGLPFNIAVAVTASKIYILEAKPKATKMSVKRVAEVWERGRFQIETEDKMTATRVTITWAEDGRQIQLDAPKHNGGVNEEILIYLADPRMSAPAVTS